MSVSSTESNVPLAVIYPDAATAPTPRVQSPSDAESNPRPTKTEPSPSDAKKPERDNDPLRLCGTSTPRHPDVVLECRIGRGGFGQVYRALDTTTGRHLAVKVIVKPERNSRLHLLKEEIRIHQLMHDDPGVPTLHYVEHNEKFVYLAMELCGPTTLVHHFHHWKPHLRTREAFFAKRDILLRAVDIIISCHDRGIYHRDIKPENILLQRNAQSVRVVDFGLAVDSMISKNTKTGTIEYMSPECFHEFDWGVHHLPFLSAPNDVWSLGVLLFWFMVGQKAWGSPSFTDSNFAAYMARPDIHFAYNFGLTFEAQHILCRALHINPVKRATIYEFRTLLGLLEGFFITEEEAEIRRKDAVSSLPEISSTELNVALNTYREFTKRRSFEKTKIIEEVRILERRIRKERRDLDNGMIPLEYSDAVVGPPTELTPENVVSKAQQYLAQYLGLHAPRVSSIHLGNDPRACVPPHLVSSRAPGAERHAGTVLIPKIFLPPPPLIADVDIADLRPKRLDPVSQGNNTLGSTLVVSPRLGGTTTLPTQEIAEQDIATAGGLKSNSKSQSDSNGNFKANANRELALKANIAVTPTPHDTPMFHPLQRFNQSYSHDYTSLGHLSPKAIAFQPGAQQPMAVSTSSLDDARRTSFLPEIEPRKHHKRHFLGISDILRKVSGHGHSNAGDVVYS